MADFLRLFRSEAGKLRSKLTDLRTKIETLRQRRELLLTAPLPASDLAAMFDEYLDACGARYQELLSKRLDFVRGMPTKAQNHLHSVHNPAWIIFPGEGQNPPGPDTIAIAFAAIFGAEVKKFARASLQRESIPGSPTRAERAAELPGLEAELHELEEQKRKIEDELDGMRKEIGA